MKRQFPLFQSHLDLAHAYWQQLLQCGDWAIDATCGNGKDTLKLAEILADKEGGVIGIDIQQQAIRRTEELVHSYLNPNCLAPIHLFHQSHEQFPPLVLQHPIRLIVYNLGYLPKADKTITTKVETTLQSIKNGLGLLLVGGVISITCYPGHTEGALEEKALLQWVSTLSSAHWSVCRHHFSNRLTSPSLLLVQKSD